MIASPRRAGPVAVAIVLLLAAVSARAATSEVRDNARLFKPETVREADNILRAIKHDHNEEVLIETYSGIPADKTAAYERVKDNAEKRTEFFAEWGRQRFRAEKVNGLNILITHEPGHVQIEVGNETVHRSFTMENRDHLRDLMLADFRKKRS
jgi:hypothetical protein